MMHIIFYSWIIWNHFKIITGWDLSTVRNKKLQLAKLTLTFQVLFCLRQKHLQDVGCATS